MEGQNISSWEIKAKTQKKRRWSQGDVAAAMKGKYEVTTQPSSNTYVNENGLI